MKNHEEKAGSCALGKIFGFEPKIGTELISHVGSAAGIFRLSQEELDNYLGPYSKFKGQIRTEALDKAADELLKLESNGINYCCWTEEEYPSILKECPDPPIGLYIRSETKCTDLWLPERKIAIVGTRDISPYGKEWCEKTVQALASCKEKPLIISGLALGTDICAHRTALELGLPTIGVMATGPESIYPHRNEQTALLMSKSPGCALITDYPPGTAPLALHFLRRNRIIAGLSQATILIESKLRGGGMMTSRLAFSYDRDVYALPGRIDDLRSQGCNELIRAKIAEPLCSTMSLLESLGMKAWKSSKKLSIREIVDYTYGDKISYEHVQNLEKILRLIKAERGISVEELAYATGLDFKQTLNLCNILESDKIISLDLLQRCSINPKII